MMKKIKILILSFSVILTANVMAQETTKANDLKKAEVQEMAFPEELNLSKDQKIKITDIVKDAEKVEKEIRSDKRLSVEKRQEKLLAIKDKKEREIKEILNEEQLATLKKLEAESKDAVKLKKVEKKTLSPKSKQLKVTKKASKVK
ncbi:hypothetical protein CW751_05580 [Brumimicrobium salinarum]|uniref:Uncharacterized protein n=1 Tax=Brumimicrobium salinarum TaxID=2058658 RepID=A0A2I0R3Y7_9FLAO|nr:hypothetical protein [Brumimicrobium salinarum]PKR81291.1 hypothetical protein CW751_05580 [Brumimicrobium salinarum]